MEATRPELEDAYHYSLEVVERLLGELDEFPHTTDRGRWRVSAHGRWTAGFWVGLIWLLYLERGDERIKREAERWLAKLAPRQYDTTAHDMGFLFEPSFVRGYRITWSGDYRAVAVQAARSLASRFREPGGYIQAWDEAEDPIHRGRTIVDTVMNLPLLTWAAGVGGDPRLHEIARRVAQTTAHYHVRPDGSTYHVVDFDPETGQAVRFTTHQGCSEESCWSRGQAWALYGFSKLYLLTSEVRWLEVAQRLADFFLDNLPADGLPYWDFRLPDLGGQPRDSSAAAIAASGLLELAACTSDRQAAERHRAGAECLLGVLVRTCLSRGVPGQHGILLHGTVDKPRDSAVDESIIYGDHYFVEALTKVLRPERRPRLNAVGATPRERTG